MKTKEFDAVEMKRQCQEAVRLRYAGMSDAERIDSTNHWLETSQDAVAMWWRRIKARQPLASTGPEKK